MLVRGELDNSILLGKGYLMRARDNPFAVHRVRTVRYRFDESDWDQLERRLDSLNFRGALVGPEGSGKTTLLEDLRERLETRGERVHWLRLSRERRRYDPERHRRLVAELSPSDWILLDGVEQMAWWRWRIFLHQMRQVHGLVVTSHKSGRLPTLWECRTTPELAEQLIRQLVGSLDDPSRQLVGRLFERHGGNIRDLLRDLYDRCSLHGSMEPHATAPPPTTS
jgi:hypothetical protein